MSEIFNVDAFFDNDFSESITYRNAITNIELTFNAQVFKTDPSLVRLQDSEISQLVYPYEIWIDRAIIAQVNLKKDTITLLDYFGKPYTGIVQKMLSCESTLYIVGMV